MNIDAVDSVTVDAMGNKTVAEIKRGVPQEGQEKGDETYFVNGMEVEESPFKAFYQASIGVLADSLNKGGTAKSDPDVTISYRMNRGNIPELSVKFYPLDRTYYIAKREGSPDFLVGRYQIEKLLNAINSVSSSAMN